MFISERKVALVIGGGSGIGAGIVDKLAADDFHVGILSSSGKGQKLANDIGGLNINGSNRNSADIQHLTEVAKRRWGRVDVLVNSAGHGPKGAILDISDEMWHEGMEFYLMNVIRAARVVAPFLKLNGGGTIINISSFAAFEPDAQFPTSAVFRAALASFTKLFADEYAAQNIRMNNVLPGYIDSLPEKDERRSQIPMGRYGTTAEVASLVSYLASDAAAYVTGQNWRIDGGLTRSV